MKIGFYTDSLDYMAVDDALDWVAELGIEAVEIGTGNFSSAPHCDLDKLVSDDRYRQQYMEAIESRGLELSALNCNGNPLDPDPARRASAQEVLRTTIEAASKMGIDTVVTMSGCPGDLEGGSYPNWVTCTWQKEFVDLVDRQWEEEIIPFWQELGSFAESREIKIAIEMHPGQSVYNTRTLMRLREIVGPAILGANLDPSHLFYQNMDPLLVIEALGQGGVFHVHTKDTRINAREMALNGGLDTRPLGNPGERSWEYVTMGYGHGETFWRHFVAALHIQGFDGVLSIEHEDPMMSAEEGIRKSVEFLKPLVPISHV